ncbi:MAG: TetR/AcrR family transcriptional regulator [Methylococcales bacterium]|nr:TetR/AcrR family transcriptional regulator [Methylococcales bacterium]
MFERITLQDKVRQCPGRPKDASKREDIVYAASQLFLERGYELTSVDAVARLADVSKLTIYSHFENKADLFKEVIRLRCEQQTAPDHFQDYAHLPIEQGLLALGRSLVELIFCPDSLRLLRIIQAEAVQHPEIVQIFYREGPQRVKTAFGELLRTWSRQGLLTVANVDRATEQFFSLLKGEAHIKAMMHLDVKMDEAELDAHVRACVRLFLAGYLARPAGGAA